MAKCLLCGKTSDQTLGLKELLCFGPLYVPPICLTCEQTFVKLQSPVCPSCDKQQTTHKLCKDCQKWQKHYGYLIANKSFYRYDTQAMKDYFERYKFLGEYRLYQVFAPLLVQYVKTYLRLGWGLVVIPSDEETLKKRGYDQVKSFYQGLELEEYFYHKQNFGRKKQSHKARAERLSSNCPFIYKGPADLKQRSFVIADDIYTTGSTLYHAASLLKTHNCGTLRFVTLAR